MTLTNLKEVVEHVCPDWTVENDAFVTTVTTKKGTVKKQTIPFTAMLQLMLLHNVNIANELNEVRSVYLESLDMLEQMTEENKV